MSDLSRILCISCLVSLFARAEIVASGRVTGRDEEGRTLLEIAMVWAPSIHDVLGNDLIYVSLFNQICGNLTNDAAPKV